MLKFLKNPRLRRTFILLLAVGAVLTGLVIWLWPYFGILGDPDRMSEIIADAGLLGPLIFIALQIVQVIIAPIPGQITGFVGGYLFGTALGTLYSMIGTTIGFAVVFAISRRLGRPFVEYFIGNHHLQKFDYLAETKGIWVLLIAFFLPLLPDAILGYLAGLTRIKIRVLLVISFIGRLPTIFLLSLAGGETADANYWALGIIVALSVIVGVIAYLKRTELEQLVKRIDRKE